MKLNLNKDKAWILSVTVVCVALLIGFAMWLNKSEVKSSLNKDNPAPEEETKEEEITELFEEEDFGETSYSFESVEIRNFDIELNQIYMMKLYLYLHAYLLNNIYKM